MRILRSLPAALAALLLAAHFLRAEQMLLVEASLALALLAFFRRPWARWTLRTALALGSLEWLRTLWTLREMRVAEGAPALRMTLILAGVAVFTALAAWWAAPAPAAREAAPVPAGPGLDGAAGEA